MSIDNLYYKFLNRKPPALALTTEGAAQQKDLDALRERILKQEAEQARAPKTGESPSAAEGERPGQSSGA